MTEFMITEEYLGFWSYHISRKDKFTEPLCGKDILCMRTDLSFNSWGVQSTHLPIKEAYCKECKRIYDEMFQ